jgi:hypothetical protein
MRGFLTGLLVLSAGCATTANQGGGDVDGGTAIARTGVTCKATGSGVGKSCTNASHNCTDLDADMKSCCGTTADVEKATCSATVQ